MKYSLMFLCFLLCVRVTYSQNRELIFEKISIEEGLSQVYVNSIIQDKKGFIWIATQDGLNKFDGYVFKVYKPDSKSDNSLRSNVIKTLFEDFEGNIWIGTAGGGLSCFDPVKERFTNYLNDPFNKSSLSNDDVYAIYQDKDSIMWIGTYGGGLNKFYPKTGVFISYMHSAEDPHSISGNTIRAINEDNSGNLWIGVDEGGLNKFDKRTAKFRHFLHDETNVNTVCSNVILTIYKDSQGKLWIGTYGGGFDIFDPVTEMFLHYKTSLTSNSLSHDIVWAFNEVDDSQMWIGTRGGGLNIFNQNTNSFSVFKKNSYKEASLTDNNILSITKDKSGVVWIGTETNGVCKVDSKIKRFNILRANTSNGILNNNIMSLIEDKLGRVWIGTRGGGISIIDKNGTISNFFPEVAKKEGFENILSMVFDGDSCIWLGTDGNGFFKVNIFTGAVLNKYKFDPTNKNSLSNNAVTSLYMDTDNILWIGTYGGGLNKFDTKKGKFRNFPIDYTNFMKNVVWNIYSDQSGIIWVGTGGKGLMRIDKKTERYIFFENIFNDPTSISNNVVLSIAEAKDGTIWVGTGGGGLNKFDRENGVFSSFTMKDGLPNDMILGIAEDNNGNLWLSTYNGISCFNPENKRFHNYFETDGIADNTLNERAYLKSKEGELFFGSINGVTHFYPDSIKSNSFLPPVVFTDFKIFNKSVGINEHINGTVILKKSITTTKVIELSYKLNVFSIEFSSLHFVEPKNNLYKYKMEGFDEDWITTDASKRFATYTNLNGGEYIFKVKASNSDGIWSEESATVKIIIIPPFYKKPWFYIFVFITLVVFVYLFIKYREKQLIKDRNRLEKMVEERTTEINQQKEELRQQSDLLSKNNEDLFRTNSLIKDSISYAKRIQDAVLPSDHFIKTHVPELFVYFKPKDIVSGDFYWFSVQKNRIYIAVSDCTGHGVPGAFMSMIGSTLLNEIIISKDEITPAEMLMKLNEGVINALNQNSDTTVDSQDDGMDITICCIDKEKNQVEIACANHIVYIEDDGDFRMHAGDICSIGGIFSGEQDKAFTNYSFPYKKGVRIFMFTDGYQDQFGGPKNKKFLASQFKDLLMNNSKIPMDNFPELLEMTFDQWKGKNKQVDDVLVMGLKL